MDDRWWMNLTRVNANWFVTRLKMKWRDLEILVHVWEEMRNEVRCPKNDLCTDLLKACAGLKRSWVDTYWNKFEIFWKFNYLSGSLQTWVEHILNQIWNIQKIVFMCRPIRNMCRHMRSKNWKFWHMNLGWLWKTQLDPCITSLGDTHANDCFSWFASQ